MRAQCSNIARVWRKPAWAVLYDEKPVKGMVHIGFDFTAHIDDRPKKLWHHPRTMMRREPSNHAIQRTATRCMFTCSMVKPVSLRVARGLGGRRSSLSR